MWQRVVEDVLFWQGHRNFFFQGTQIKWVKEVFPILWVSLCIDPAYFCWTFPTLCFFTQGCTESWHEGSLAIRARSVTWFQATKGLRVKTQVSNMMLSVSVGLLTLRLHPSVVFAFLIFICGMERSGNHDDLPSQCLVGFWSSGVQWEKLCLHRENNYKIYLFIFNRCCALLVGWEGEGSRELEMGCPV